MSKTDVFPNNSVEVTVKMPLWGAQSLATAFLSEKAIRSQRLPSDAGAEAGHTGLVIDVGGLV